MAHPTFTRIDDVVGYYLLDEYICDSCTWRIDADEFANAPVVFYGEADGVQCGTCDGWLNGVPRVELEKVTVRLVDAWGNVTRVNVDVVLPVLGGWIHLRDDIEEHNRECARIVEGLVDAAADMCGTWVADYTATRGRAGVLEFTAHIGDAFADDAAADLAAIAAAVTAVPA